MEFTRQGRRFYIASRAGALGVGATAVLFAGDNTAYLGQTRAHHTFTAWRQFTDALPSIAPN